VLLMVGSRAVRRLLPDLAQSHRFYVRPPRETLANCESFRTSEAT
jgi:hypothetical protein